VSLIDDYRYWITLFIAINRRAGELSLLVEGIIAHSTEETILFKSTWEWIEGYLPNLAVITRPSGIADMIWIGRVFSGLISF
jgi:hypothetical protein